MTLTISIEGKGVIANADSETNDTGGDGTGDWGFTGSGGVSWGLTTDTYKYGSASISAAFSGSKDGWLWFNTGTGTGYPLDFSSSGTEYQQHIYIWVSCPTIGLTTTLVNEAVTIRIGSSTSNYNDYTIAGSDGSNHWDGAFKCFVIDPTKTASNTGGTIDLSSIQYIGARMQTTATAKGDNLFISQIAVGKGIRVTGTSTTAWKDVVDYCIDYPNRAWGMFQEREGTYYQYGKIYIGDTTQTANVSFTDSGRVIQAGISEYWISGTGWVTSADIDYSGIVIEDNSSYTTTFKDGVLVGTDNGRSGSTIIGNSNHHYSLDLYGGNNSNSLTELYGTSFKNITGAINSGNDSDHKFLGVSMAGCEQFDPVGAPVIRNCTFAETASVDSALLWNESIDISNCNFIANTLGAGIEMPSSAGTPYSYDSLIFSGNTNDVLNSSGSAISINKNNGSNPSTSEGSGVTFLGVSVTTSITVKDSEGTEIQGARVLVWVTDNSNYFYQATPTSITGSGTTATVTQTAHGLVTGDNVIIEGVTNDDTYNGVYSVTVTGVDTYTYTTNETITSGTASGTIKTTFAVINDITDSSGVASDIRSWGTEQLIEGRVRKSTTSPYYKQGNISGSINTTSGFTTIVQMISDE